MRYYKVPAIHVRYRDVRHKYKRQRQPKDNDDDGQTQGPKGDSLFTIIYSHGNAEDIGCNVDFYRYLSLVAGADVLGYEYPVSEIRAMLVLT